MAVKFDVVDTVEVAIPDDYSAVVKVTSASGGIVIEDLRSDSKNRPHDPGTLNLGGGPYKKGDAIEFNNDNVVLRVKA
jgi:hypothetical protein